MRRVVAPCHLYQMDLTGLSGAGYVYNSADNEDVTHKEHVLPCP